MTSETPKPNAHRFMMYACLSSARHGSLREASTFFSTTSRTPPPITSASSPVVIAARSFCRF